MATVTLVALGVAVGIGALFFATSNGVEFTAPSQKAVAHRNANYFYEPWSSVISNTAYTYGNFAKNARVIRQGRGELEIPLYEVEIDGRRTQVYRMPSEL